MKLKKANQKSKKTNLEKLGKEFNSRHDFKSEDLDILKSNFSNITFKNIPEAWIVILDSMLRELDTRYVYSIEQHFGFICINENKNSNLNLSVINKYEKKLYKIDIDLHNENIL